MQHINNLNVKRVFSKRLRALREENQLSQDALAEKLGISRGSISFYENGTRTPDIEVFCHMASFFNVSLNYLIGLANAGKPENEEISEQIGLSDKAIDILKSKKRSSLPLFVNALIEHSNSCELATYFSKLKNDAENLNDIFKNTAIDFDADEEKIAENIITNREMLKKQSLDFAKNIDRRAEILFGEKILNFERYEVERIFRNMLLEMAGTNEIKIKQAKISSLHGKDPGINDITIKNVRYDLF